MPDVRPSCEHEVVKVKRGGGEIPARKMAKSTEVSGEPVEVSAEQEPDGVDDYFEMKYKQRAGLADLQD